MIQFYKKNFPFRDYIRRWSSEKKRRLLFLCAFMWRLSLIKTTFIAVSGSTGKTTTKELLAGILSSRYATEKTSGTLGGMKFGVLRTIFSIRPWHRYAIIETAIEEPGQMARMAKLVRPDIVVMLAVKRCHTNKFKDLDSIAGEKKKLLDMLSPEKLAVLNGDDPRVMAMRDGQKCRNCIFGSSKAFDFSATQCNSLWPKRLELQIHSGDRSYFLKTSLVGTHWVKSILAALAASSSCGIDLKAGIEHIETFQPFWARMQPVTLPRGATFIRDEWNGSIDTFKVALKVLADAKADRKLMAVSDFSDSRRKPRDRIKHLGREGALIADILIFIGTRGHYGIKAAVAEGMNPDNVYSFPTVKAAAGFIDHILCPGDLVLLKGRTSDHLSRIYLAQLGPVKCELETCSIQMLCDRCEKLGFQWSSKLEGLMAPPNVHV